MKYKVVSNRAEEPLAVCNDLSHAGRIVDALMRTRFDESWLDYWVIDENGGEYYHDAENRTVVLYHL